MGAGDIKGNKNTNPGLESSRCRENHKHTMDCSGQDNEDHGVYGGARSLSSPPFFLRR